jgi:imidazolonepropionase-like amidohydrolase
MMKRTRLIEENRHRSLRSYSWHLCTLWDRPIKAVVASLLLFTTVTTALAQRNHLTETAPIALTDVSIIDVNNGRVLPRFNVVITGNRISEISKGQIRGLPKATRRISGRGKFLIPGLWDMHVHLSHLGEDSLRVFLANGVTSVRDMGGVFDQVKVWRDEVAAGTRLGPRIKAAGPIIENARWIAAVREMSKKANNKEPDWLAYRVGVLTPEDARKAVDSIADSGADLIKIRNNPSREAFLALADQAKRRGLLFVGHQPARITLAEASDAGMSSIEHGFFPALNLNQDERAELFSRFARNRTSIVPTLIATRNFRLLPDSVVAVALDDKNTTEPRRSYVSAKVLEGWREEMKLKKEETGQIDWPGIYQSTARNVREMTERGVNVMAGTDAGSVLVFPGFSLHEELHLLVVDAGLSPLQALQAATINPAKYLGLTDSFGAIEKGKIADLVLLNANPLENIDNTRKVEAVIINGRYLSSQDLQSILTEVSQRRRE